MGTKRRDSFKVSKQLYIDETFIASDISTSP